MEKFTVYLLSDAQPSRDARSIVDCTFSPRSEERSSDQQRWINIVNKTVCIQVYAIWNHLQERGHDTFQQEVLVETGAELLTETKCENSYTESSLLFASSELHP